MTNEEKRVTMAHITLMKLIEANPTINSVYLVEAAITTTDRLLDELERTKLERMALKGESYS